MATLQIPTILVDFENEREDSSEEEGKREEEEHEEGQEEEQENIRSENEADIQEESKPSKKKKNFFLNLKKYSRPRAKSIDAGNPFYPQQPDHDQTHLHIDEDDLAKRLSPKKSKNKIKKKLQSFIKKGSELTSGTTSPVPQRGRNRAYSIDFSHTNNDFLSLSPTLSQLIQGDDKPRMSRRESLVEAPEGTFPHKVGSDETLASIAVKHKSTVGEIKSINKLMNDMVFPDQVLHIPEEPLSVRRARLRSESAVSDEMSRPASPNKLESLTEEHHNSGDDGESAQPNRRGSGDTLQVDMGSRPRRSSVVVGIGIGNLLAKKAQNFSFDKKKKGKDKKNSKLKITESLSSGSLEQFDLPRPKSNIFSATIHYMTGAENVPGLLVMTQNDVTFEPFKITDRENPDGKPALNTINDLIKHRMSLANQLFSASISDHAPQKKKDGDETESKIETTTKPHKYLCLRLAKKKNVKSGQTPFLEALIKNVLPGPKFQEHHFIMSLKIVEELETYLKYYYFECYNRLNQEEDEVSTGPSVPDVNDIKSKRETFRRTLSVAELSSLELPEMSEESRVFTAGHIRVFREFLPPKVDGRPWELGYATWKHGFSLSTMYRCLEKEPMDSVALLIIEDTSYQVFGALVCGGGVRKSKGFYGTGESFLFSFHNFFQKFSWTGSNYCIAIGNADSFTVGSSDSKLGLSIEKNLEKGFTDECKTFDNKALTTDTIFTIHTLEVWLFPMELSE